MLLLSVLMCVRVGVDRGLMHFCFNIQLNMHNLCGASFWHKGQGGLFVFFSIDLFCVYIDRTLAFLLLFT